MDTPILRLISRYPQLMLEIYEGASTSEKYKEVVLQGKTLGPANASNYSTTSEDNLYLVDTPVGPAEILYVANRSDFERILQVLAFRCEPRLISPTTGAMIIKGIINHGKLRQKRMVLTLTNVENAEREYQYYLQNSENYKDTLIVLSKGEYSALPYTMTQYSYEEWMGYSKKIREYHELTHFISSKLYPENKNIVRDEIIADCIGIMGATGSYDPDLARAFLGIAGESDATNGRLKNYVAAEELKRAVEYANRAIDILDEKSRWQDFSPFEFLQYVEQHKIAF